MNIRAGIPEDTNSIIELLKKSLGESTIPKSEALWNWKHIKNPFGKSYILLAEENSELIGVRAFMQWKWLWKGKIYKTVRAVDTATHPEHQGKGVFKKLTLQQAEICKKDGVDFIFNTPNNQSKPGYLKMGWVEQEKVPLKLKLFSLLRKKRADDIASEFDWNDELKRLIISAVSNDEFIATPVSPAYIEWRYINNPLFPYLFISDRNNYLIICRIKEQQRFSELRIADFLLFKQTANTGAIAKNIRQQVYHLCRQQRVNIISFSGRRYNLYKHYFKWMGIIPVVSAGPVVTLRDLNMHGNFESVLNVNNWSYSLGDLELF